MENINLLFEIQLPKQQKSIYLQNANFYRSHGENQSTWLLVIDHTRDSWGNSVITLLYFLWLSPGVEYSRVNKTIGRGSFWIRFQD